MRNLFETIFKKKSGVVIGAIHLPPLVDFPDFPGYEIATENALADLRAFEEGGVDAVIFENNYDIPHTEKISPATAEAMIKIGHAVCAATKLPVGVSVLWNDYAAGFKIAKELGLGFIRIPVFVDTVETSYGVIKGDADDVAAARKQLNTENVAIFTDIHVKHSKVISAHTLEESARLAITKGSDALIVTGSWTGDSPSMEKLQRVRSAIQDFPIIVGSGASAENVAALGNLANGFIVSTSLKDGGNKPDEVNVKGYEQRVSTSKTAEFMKVVS